MADKRSSLSEDAEIVQLIIFNLGDEEFGVAIGTVREIIRTGSITPIPDSPEFIKGVINVRGEVVATVDLKARFFSRAEKELESKQILITEQDNNIFGLMVGEVTEVLRIPSTSIKPAPELVTNVHEKYVSGVVTLDDRLIILLDLAKIMSVEELARLAEAQRMDRPHEEGLLRLRQTSRKGQDLSEEKTT